MSGIKILTSYYQSRCLNLNRAKTCITWMTHNFDNNAIRSVPNKISFGTRFVLCLTSMCYLGFQRHQSSDFIRMTDELIEALVVLPTNPLFVTWGYNTSNICVDPSRSENNTNVDDCTSTVTVFSRSSSKSNDYSNDNSYKDKNKEARGDNHFHRRRRPPPVFGSSLQLLLNDTHQSTPCSSGDELIVVPGNRHEDCPICVKYSQVR
jgi:hypothetical protein